MKCLKCEKRFVELNDMAIVLKSTCVGCGYEFTISQGLCRKCMNKINGAEMPKNKKTIIEEEQVYCIGCDKEGGTK